MESDRKKERDIGQLIQNVGNRAWFGRYTIAGVTTTNKSAEMAGERRNGISLGSYKGMYHDSILF